MPSDEYSGEGHQSWTLQIWRALAEEWKERTWWGKITGHYIFACMLLVTPLLIIADLVAVSIDIWNDRIPPVYKEEKGNGD